VITGLIDRAFLLSHPEFHQKNIELVVRVLLQNDYPLGLVFSTIRSRIKSLMEGKIKLQNNENEHSDKKIWFTVPYVDSISEKF